GKSGDGLAPPNDFDDGGREARLQRGVLVGAPLVGQVHLPRRDQAEKRGEARAKGAFGPKVFFDSAERLGRLGAVQRDGERAAPGRAAGARERIVDAFGGFVVHVLAPRRGETGTGRGINHGAGGRGGKSPRRLRAALPEGGAEP